MLALAASVAGMTSCALDDPTSVIGSSVLVVDVQSDAAPADGSARLSIHVDLLGDTPTGTEVTLTTDAGSFAGAPSSSPRELKVKSPSRGIDATLIAGVDPMTATVRAAVGGFVVSDTVQLVQATPQLMELTTDVSKVQANGQTAITLSARARRTAINQRVSRGTRVQFTISENGRDAPELSSIVETDSTEVARRTLVTRVPGSYRVIASASGVADTVTVEFTP
jgi:hypothetical protein